MSEMKLTIEPKELWARLHGDGEPFFILDVRNAEDAARWRIEGPREVPSVNVPYFSFIDDEDGAVAQVPAGLGEAVVICARSHSSELVAEVLRAHGRRALNLAGGMAAWGDLHVPLLVHREPAFELWQLNRFGKGCLSYAVLSGGEAAIVDPSRFADVYESFAREHGVRVVEVLETHVHADHLSGGAALAARTGARYRVLEGAGHEPRLGVEVTPFEDGETELRLGGAGGISIGARAIRTPGHTPGSVSYLVGGRFLLSGDTLFVHGVGRPDLGGHVEEWGRALFSTLRDVVSRFPDEMVVLPAHFSGAREESEGGVVRGALGELRRNAPELRIASAEEFVAAMKAGVKEPPVIYGEIMKANLGLVDPGEKAAEWELGRNECAATAARRLAACG